MTGYAPDAAGWFCADVTGKADVLADFDALADGMSTTALRPLLVRAWVRGGSQDALGAQRWVALFRRVGFTHDGQPAALPTEPVRIFRGGRHGAGRMAWTTSRTVAQEYAADAVGGPRRRPLWTAQADPEALLATRTGDREVVVDPARLGAVEAVPWGDPFREERPAARPGLRMVLGAQSRLDRVMTGTPAPGYAGTTVADVLAGEVRRYRQREVARRARWSTPAPTRRRGLADW